ncbi:MAG: phosphate signaling complex protein PhoU, partial [Acidobacteria bacterium]
TVLFYKNFELGVGVNDLGSEIDWSTTVKRHTYSDSLNEFSTALVGRDRALIQKVQANEPKLDRYQLEIDSEAIRLITIYAPIAKDLRFLLMVARINSELERIGDQALNNSEYVLLLLSAPPAQTLRDISRMSEITRGMVHDALQAFHDEDTERARQVLKADDEVDALNSQTFRDLLTDKNVDLDTINQSMTLILLARSLERIADHATNICEEVIYLVKGEDIRHQT